MRGGKREGAGRPKKEGELMTLPESAEKSKIPYPVLNDRYCRGDRGEYLFRPITDDNITNAKLTKDDANKIRQLYSTGEFTYKKLGKIFGVCPQTICNVINRKT